MKRIVGLIIYGLSLGGLAGEVSVTGITAQQRYPWNGLVDIVVTLMGSADDLAEVEFVFAANNSATKAAVPIASIAPEEGDAGSNSTLTRRFIWNAAKDVGEVKINDLVLTVDIVTDCVQLWECGPYWAKCNVGASKPEECGYYFWWGDTVGYKRNASNDGWVSVKDGSVFLFSSSNCSTFGMDYSQLKSDGYIDSTGKLLADHDAATAHLGAPWRMPTHAELSALVGNCDTTWTMRGGACGRLVTGKGAYAGKSIFLPAAGNGANSRIDNGSHGYYLSSSLHMSYSGYTWALCFSSGHFYPLESADCWNGKSVRPVRGNSELGDVSESGVTTHMALDCRSGIRVQSPDGETLRYDASWCENGEEVRITDNGIVVATGTAGSCTWRPVSDRSSLQHLLKLEIMSGGQVVGTETAQYDALGYIRNVTARQLWPHNKVALSFTVAEDIGEVKRANENLSVWCARGLDTNVATRIVGDRSAKPGVHRIIWDMEADKLILANVEAVFGVSVEEMIPLGGVQLWEDGPYWAECNVGASKPEEYGHYFWWGDTVGYKLNADNNGWVSVKDGTSYSFSSDTCPTYYLSNSQLKLEGYIDSTGNLVATHDAATANLGSPWRMPTDAEIDALVNNCTTTWITTNGVTGRLVTGKGAYSSNSIFLPAADFSDSPFFYFNRVGSYGYYWSSTPHSDNLNFAWILYFESGKFSRTYYFRYYGQSVRPLRGYAK